LDGSLRKLDMKTTQRIIVVLALIGAVAAVLVLKGRNQEADSGGPAATEPLPRLVDLGADKCASCKMMMPVLAELRKTYAGTFDVEFIDVWQQPTSAKIFKVRMIPTQIFFNAAGDELYRHEGFLSRDDILAVWRKHGVAVEPNSQSRAQE